jgi:cytochrome c553
MSTRIRRRRRSGRSEFQLPATTGAARKTPVRKPKKTTHTCTHTHDQSGEKTQQKRAPRSSSLEDL